MPMFTIHCIINNNYILTLFSSGESQFWKIVLRSGPQKSLCVRQDHDQTLSGHHKSTEAATIMLSVYPNKAEALQNKYNC